MIDVGEMNFRGDLFKHVKFKNERLSPISIYPPSQVISTYLLIGKTEKTFISNNSSNPPLIYCVYPCLV